MTPEIPQTQDKLGDMPQTNDAIKAPPMVATMTVNDITD